MGEAAVVNVIESRQLGDQIECVVEVYEGSVSVGDKVALEGTASDTRSPRWEIVEIRYFQHLIDTLETNFGGQLLMVAHGLSGLLPRPGSRLVLMPKTD
jgi:hypothetical protein